MQQASDNFKPTGAPFLKQVKRHIMSVKLDVPGYRHLFFAAPKKSFATGDYGSWFELITWPGSLCINGDHGTFCFSRTEDMFAFFRAKPEYQIINPDYWSEKCVAVDRSGGMREYSRAIAEAAVMSHIKSFSEDLTLSQRELTSLKQSVRRSVVFDQGEEALRRSLSDFRWCDNDGDTIFSDFWEAEVRDWTEHLIWCSKRSCGASKNTI